MNSNNLSFINVLWMVFCLSFYKSSPMLGFGIIQGFVLYRIAFFSCWFHDIITYILKFSKIGKERGNSCSTFSWVLGDVSAFSLKTEHEVASVHSLHGTPASPIAVVTQPFTLYKTNWEIILLLVQFLYSTTCYQLRAARWCN